MITKQLLLRTSLRYATLSRTHSHLHPPPSYLIRSKATQSSLKQAVTAPKTKSNLNNVKKSSSSSDNRPLSQLLNCFLAVSAAVTTVSMTAFVVEQVTGDSVPEFDVQSNRFDQSTYVGRFCKMLLACDSRLLFYSEEEVVRARNMVLNAESLIQSPPAGVKNIHRTLWEAHRISSASLNGEEKIPHSFRLSGFVPFNGPICAAMVCSSSTPSLLFWNWINQSQNAGVNYFNRNAASNMSDETLLKSYVGAVGAALSVAFGLSYFVQKRFDVTQAKQIMRFVAFPSTVIASSLNCFIVRSPEIDIGIPMMDKYGREIQMPFGEDSLSQIAAEKGVYATTASRAITNIPVLLLPPVLVANVPFFKNAIAKSPAMITPITVYVLLTCFGIGLPAACAIFPQIVEISTNDLESKFHNLRSAEGQKIEKLYYNKGL